MLCLSSCLESARYSLCCQMVVAGLLLWTINVPYLLLLQSVSVSWPELPCSSAGNTALCAQHREPPQWSSMAWDNSWFTRLYTGGICSTVASPHNMTCWFTPLKLKGWPVEVCSISTSSRCLQDEQEVIPKLQMLVSMKVPPTEIRMGPRRRVHSKVGLTR